MSSNEIRLTIPLHSSVDITELAPIEVVALPAVGHGAAWLSNRTVYRSPSPESALEKLCQADFCDLSFSPDGELLAVLSWANQNDERRLRVFDRSGVCREAESKRYFESVAWGVGWLDNTKLFTFGSAGRIPLQVDDGERLIRKLQQENPWESGSLMCSLGGRIAIRYDDRTELVSAVDGAKLQSLGKIDVTNETSFATCSDSAVALG